MAYSAEQRERQRVYNKQWRVANAARKKAMDLAWRKAHPDCRKREYARHAEAIKERNRKQYAADPGSWKARSKAWREANPDRANAKTKAWHKKHPERVRAIKRAWVVAHPEYHAQVESRRRALKRNVTTEKVDFKEVLLDAKGLCGICEKPLDLFGIDFDHIIPLSRGGTHTRVNIQPTHSYCNRSKGARLA